MDGNQPLFNLVLDFISTLAAKILHSLVASWSHTVSFPECAGKMTGECWWLRDATEPAHSLSASQNLKLLLCSYLLSSRFIVVVGLGNKMNKQQRGETNGKEKGNE